MKSLFKVDFSIEGLTLTDQQAIFDSILPRLTYNQRQSFHITVTDPLGGVHYIWDDKGVDPSGAPCKNCKLVDCTGCAVYEERMKKNGK